MKKQLTITALCILSFAACRKADVTPPEDAVHQKVRTASRGAIIPPDQVPKTVTISTVYLMSSYSVTFTYWQSQTSVGGSNGYVTVGSNIHATITGGNHSHSWTSTGVYINVNGTGFVIRGKDSYSIVTRLSGAMVVTDDVTIEGIYDTVTGSWTFSVHLDQTF